MLGITYDLTATKGEPNQDKRRRRLFEVAALQDGCFSSAQAGEGAYDSRTVW
jgi:hypothetical protein